MNQDLKKNIHNLFKWLDSQEIKYVQNFDLKKKSWIKCGGIAKIFIEPDTIKKTEDLAKHLVKEKIYYYPIGNLSNILIRDGEIYTPIINLRNIINPITHLNGNNKNTISVKVASGFFND